MNEPVTFRLGDFRLQQGMTLKDARIVYKTYGRLNADKSNAILYPTSYGAHHTDIEWLIGEDRVLDPTRWFIVIPNMFGSGLSSSPSNTPFPYDRGRYPHVTTWDNVMAQRRLLTEAFGIDRLALVYGWSMGGQQAYQWGAAFPDKVDRVAAVCTSARTSPHNRLFIDGVRAALTADPAWRDGWFAEPPLRGLRAMGRLYAGWAMSQTFYRKELWRGLGYASMEDFIVAAWEGNFRRRDANDLLAQFWTWEHNDISDNEMYRGDLAAALGAIEARTFVMPGETDLYFQVDDSRAEMVHLRNAELRPIPSVWGHRAGNPVQNREDERFLIQAVRDLLAD